MALPRPDVDIIIPFHKQYESTTRCVSSILKCTPNQEYRIILVDDCSPNENYLRIMTNNKRKIAGVRLGEHSGFGAGLKAGFDLGTGSHVVFMHSDVYIDNINWLANLQRALGRLKDDGVKLVCSRVDNCGTGLHNDALCSPEEVVTDFACPMICCYGHRDLFSKVGFVKPYKYAWYEDEEFYWRMKRHGYRQAVIGNSSVRHVGGLTVREVWQNVPKSKQTMESNHSLCLKDISSK